MDTRSLGLSNRLALLQEYIFLSFGNIWYPIQVGSLCIMYSYELHIHTQFEADFISGCTTSSGNSKILQFGLTFELLSRTECVIRKSRCCFYSWILIWRKLIKWEILVWNHELEYNFGCPSNIYRHEVIGAGWLIN